MILRISVTDLSESGLAFEKRHTPSTAAANYGTCGDPNNPSDDPTEIESYCPDSCGDGDGCDMQWNYMDYADDHCLSAFTEGQAYRMLYYLATGRSTMVSGWGSEIFDSSMKQTLDSINVYKHIIK